MNFAEIQNEVIQSRFRETQRASVKHWINQRYQQVWSLADWPFKRVGPVPLTILSGDQYPTLPSGFNRPISVYDEDGLLVPMLAADEFEELLTFRLETTGTPEMYKWSDRTITLSPIPDDDYSYTMIYERRVSRLVNGVADTVGLMNADTDTPLWDEEFHYLLVQGAIATGLKMENDPTWQPLEAEFIDHVNDMREHYLPSSMASAHLQYGRDMLGN